MSGYHDPAIRAGYPPSHWTHHPPSRQRSGWPVAPRALRRVAHRAARWLPAAFETAEAYAPRTAALLADLRLQASEAGRDPDALGVEVQVRLTDLPSSRLAR